MKLVMRDPEGDQNIHVKKVFHGKLESNSATSLLVNTGASGPALSAE